MTVKVADIQLIFNRLGFHQKTLQTLIASRLLLDKNCTFAAPNPATEDCSWLRMSLCHFGLGLFQDVYLPSISAES